MENDTSQQLISGLDRVITDYINSAKRNHKKVTRDDLIAILTIRLKELMAESSGNQERTWLLSGMSLGMAMVLQIELKLSDIER